MRDLFQKTIIGIIIVSIYFPAYLFAQTEVPVHEEYIRLTTEHLRQAYTPDTGLNNALFQDMLNKIEDELGIDKDMMRRARRKAEAPTVEVVFDITDPKEGEKVTAYAVPQMFRNNKERLFYTWYIIHTNEEGEPTNSLEDGKREAMGRIARGSFDPNIFGIDYSTETDNDGYETYYGGSDGVGSKSGFGTDCDDCPECLCLEADECLGCFDDQGAALLDHEVREYIKKMISNTSAITRCYKRNFGIQERNGEFTDYSGRDLIVSCPDSNEFPTCNGFEVGNNEFGLGEEECWKTDPFSSDTDGDGVIDEADVAGLGQDQFTWNYKKGDRVGVIVEGTSTIAINEGTTARSVLEWEGPFSWDYAEAPPIGAMGLMSGYYKIMWATTGICTEEDMEFIDGDYCDEEEHIGFPYLESRDVVEEPEQRFGVDIEYAPKDPQFSTVDDHYTDMIVADAIIDNYDGNKDFLYYRWFVLRCSPDDLEVCDLVTSTVNFETYREGIGLKQISFRPTEATFEGGATKALLKLVVLVSKHKSDYLRDPSPGVGLDEGGEIEEISIGRGAMAEQLIPVVENNLEIILYRGFPIGDDVTFNSWMADDEICDAGLYWQVCPVYPFQVIVAEVSYPGEVESFAWQLNGQSFLPPRLPPGRCEEVLQPEVCRGHEEMDGFGYVVYFPITGTDRELVTLSVTAERVNEEENIKDDDLVAERILSVNYPLSALSFSGNVRVAQNVRGVLDEMYEAPVGETIEVTTDLVPDYLEFEDADYPVSVQWFWNGKEIASHSHSQTVSIGLPEEPGMIGTLKVRIKRTFRQTRLMGLSETWGLDGSHVLVKDTVIKIKTIGEGGGELSSIGGFMASTIANAPDFLVFAIRMVISVFIIWLLIFGLAQFIGLRKENKKLG